MTNTLPSKQRFDEYAKLGLITARSHDELPLTIYKYSIFTNYARLWNNVTKTARGIVFDDKDRCIVRCMTKFFNEEEPHATCEIDFKKKVTYFNKLDGSLIQVVNDVEYGLIVTSSGSFHSDHARWATDYINKNYSVDDFEQGLTYAFELIHPNNRIVVDYGDTFKMYLLAVIDIDSGLEYEIYDPRFDTFERVEVITDIEKHMSLHNVEGIVAKVGQDRYKMKTGEYIQMHRIVTEFTPKKVWEALSTGSSLEFENMPEEFQTWLDTTVKTVQDSYNDLLIDIGQEAEATKDLTPKEIGLAKDLKYKGFIFALRNGKDISEDAWKLVKPKEEKA